jgi:hypothetical protein
VRKLPTSKLNYTEDANRQNSFDFNHHLRRKIMKKLTALTALVLGMGVSTLALAEGSTIQQSTISNRATVQNSANIAQGGLLGSAEANQGSVQIKGSTVKQSTISNQATVKNSANIAKGGLLGSATANQGSIQVK